MVAFATSEDLGKQLNRTFDAAEIVWVTDLLETASDYLRSEIGWDMFPVRSTTFTTWPDADGEVPLPQHPVVSVDSVTVDGAPVAFVYQRGILKVAVDSDVDVTFTFGASEAPSDLRMWACVLVSQMLFPLEQQLGMTVGGLSSVAIDDFKVAFADGGDKTGLYLSDRTLGHLRSKYRGSVTVGGSR